MSKNTLGYPEVPNGKERYPGVYTEVLRGTEKTGTQGTQASQDKRYTGDPYVPRGTRGIRGVPRSTQRYRKVPRGSQRYPEAQKRYPEGPKGPKRIEGTERAPEVPRGTQ